MVLEPDASYRRAFTLRVGQTDQSYVDLDDPERLEFDYVRRLADVLESVLPESHPVRVLHIGGAGLTLPRYLAARFPGSAQTVLEPDEELTALVRVELPLPPHCGIKVRAVDGLTGVGDLREGFAGVVVLDAFAGAQVPAELTTLDFLREVRRVLTPGGLMLINLTDQGRLDYTRRVLAGATTIFAEVLLLAESSTLRGRRFGNLVLACSDARLPAVAIARRAGQGPYPYRVLHGPRLAQFLGAGRPFAVGDAQASPEPPESWFS